MLLHSRRLVYICLGLRKEQPVLVQPCLLRPPLHHPVFLRAFDQVTLRAQPTIPILTCVVSSDFFNFNGLHLDLLAQFDQRPVDILLTQTRRRGRLHHLKVR